MEEKFRKRFEKDMIEKYDTHFSWAPYMHIRAQWIVVGLFYPRHHSALLYILSVASLTIRAAAWLKSSRELFLALIFASGDQRPRFFISNNMGMFARQWRRFHPSVALKIRERIRADLAACIPCQQSKPAGRPVEFKLHHYHFSGARERRRAFEGEPSMDLTLLRVFPVQTSLMR